MRLLCTATIGTMALSLATAAPAQVAPARLDALKAEAATGVEKRAKLVQEMIDSIFSFGELGMQEVETSRYITAVLEKNGFKVTRGIAGIPTAWSATWTQGSGGPTIAVGSDLDGIPKASQKPGVAWREPMIAGAPGHGEGHNSGQAVNIAAALAVKDIMIREKIPGTLLLWPGVAEEPVAAKAFFVRDGLFKDVDAVLFTHVGSNLQTSWGQPSGTGGVSVLYTFSGESAHSAGAPWRGRSALDAVELMDAGWNFRREHLRPEQRSHYVIKDGGDFPNVVPSTATVWYYFREQSFGDIRKNYEIGNKIATAAAMMTDTEVTRRIIGTAAPQHMNRPIAEAAYENIKKVGLPQWTPEEQQFAKAVQKLVAGKEKGLETKLDELKAPDEEPKSGGSDDIGDVSWTKPTITIRYPSNIPELPGHNWSNAIAMATPIAHKGAVAGGKAMAMTLLDLLTRPELLTAAKSYFTDVQTKDVKYQPILTDEKPYVEMNADIMAQFRDRMRQQYYDPKKYDTYLQQIGVKWPSLVKPE
ncbi:peptidase dimerization domain-containing protein [Sphingomonas radiodurans]|uniref:peptidase dimerization domain-containing protein n=1 Tax=Sphingomonas radiodurans TaxID=2890321 RepID=UPI001E4822BC|nr:peptidase dimerization domain-containing protein [Sphingomonas radiodurans]WBH15880.1 peptidase dimerization domain-containing protein [Sphingomonas radiodurans]